MFARAGQSEVYPAGTAQTRRELTKGDMMKRLVPDEVKPGCIGLGNMGNRIANWLLDQDID